MTTLLRAKIILIVALSLCMSIKAAQLTVALVRVEVGDTTATVNGAGLNSFSKVTINGQPRPSVFNFATTPTSLTISLLPSDSASVGETETVLVTNSGGVSATTSLLVYAPTGTILTTSKFNNNIPVYSNGRNTGTDGGQYQCINLIKRYYQALAPTIYGPGAPHDVHGWDEALAVDYYTDNPEAKGLLRIPNDGSTLPIPGDIVVFEGLDPAASAGHVAIVDSVQTSASTGIEIIEQNWSTAGRKILSLDLSRRLNDRGNCPQGSPGGGSCYQILGFLRALIPAITNISPTSIPVGQLTLTITGTAFSSDDAVVFGGVMLSPTSVTSTQITVLVTATVSQVGIVPVTVVNGSVSSNSSDVTVVNVSSANSGSTAVIAGTVNGTMVDKAYVPVASSGQVAVINVDSSSSTGALIKSIAMPVGYLPNATAADIVTQQVIVVSYRSPDVQIIDASQDILTATVTSPVARFASFSGGSCMICGVLIDTATDSAILDTAEGYMLLNLTTHQFSTLVGTVAGENFAFNPNTGNILNPTYYQSVPAGLQLVSAGGGPVFTYSFSVGNNPDATAVDISTNIALVPDEFTGNQYLINLNNAGFNVLTTPPQFAAPYTIFPINFTACGSEQNDWSMVSVENTSHLAFVGTEFADCAAVESLPTSVISGAPPAPPIFHWGHMPLSPDGFTWNNGGDPHGIAVFTSVVDGKPYGFLIRSDQAWVARIDLAGVKSAPLIAGGLENQVDLAPFVAFLKTQ